MKEYWPMNDLEIAVIPVMETGGSDTPKSFAETIYDKSLLEIRIEQLKAGNQFDKIYLSSGSRNVKEIADRHQVDFIFRNSDIYTRHSKWSDVLYAVANAAHGFNPVMAWLKRTNVLHDECSTTKRIKQNNFLFDNHITVTTIQDSASSTNQKMTKYYWGILNSNSEDLEKLYRQTGALLIARKREMFKVRSAVDVKPHMQIVNRNMGAGVVTNENILLSESIRNNRFIQKAV